jgi:hypothetical protein
VRAFLLALHAAENPFARGRHVNEDAITDFRVGKSVGLIEPAADCAGMAIDLFGEWIEIEKVLEQV